MISNNNTNLNLSYHPPNPCTRCIAYITYRLSQAKKNYPKTFIPIIIIYTSTRQQPGLFSAKRWQDTSLLCPLYARFPSSSLTQWQGREQCSYVTRGVTRWRQTGTIEEVWEISSASWFGATDSATTFKGNKKVRPPPPPRPHPHPPPPQLLSLSVSSLFVVVVVVVVAVAAAAAAFCCWCCCCCF